MKRDAATTGRLFFEEQDRLRGGPAPDLCTSDYRAHLGGYPPMDLDAHATFSTAFYAAFPDLEHHVEQVVANGDAVAVRFTIAGTHKEDFMGAPSSGRTVSVGGIAIMEIEGGRIRTLHGQFDQWALMVQIGAIEG